MNPLKWTRDYQVAFLVSILVGAGIGVYVGLREIDPAAEHYSIHVGLWGVGGAVLSAIGAMIRQSMRNQNPK